MPDESKKLPVSAALRRVRGRARRRGPGAPGDRLTSREQRWQRFMQYAMKKGRRS